MKSKSAAANSVVSQSKLRKQKIENVLELPLARVDPGVNVKGEKTLKAIFPGKNNAFFEFSISYCLKASNLSSMFSNAFIDWGRNKRNGTRKTQAIELKNFFDFLVDIDKAHIHKNDINEDLLIDYRSWLLKRKQRNGNPLKITSVQSILGCLRSILQHTEIGALIDDIMPRLPKGTSLKSTPTKEIPWPQLISIWTAAENEVLKLNNRWKEGRQLLAYGKELLEQNRQIDANPCGKIKNNNKENLALCLAMLDEMYPNYIPSLRDIRKVNKPLADTLQHSLNLTKVRTYLYPSPRELVPLILLIAIATAFNPEAVLRLEWKNIKRDIDRLGVDSIEISSPNDSTPDDEVQNLLMIESFKPRANKTYRRLLDPQPTSNSEVGLNMVFDLLHQITERPRKYTTAEYKDRLFLYVPSLTGGGGPRGFGTEVDAAVGGSSWFLYLARFCDENEIPKFHLKQIRLTLIDYVHLINRGDLEAARKVGNHSRRITTWNHYTSNTVKRLLQESSGEIMILRDRWLDTFGIVDPRITPVNFDKSCATPGFSCLDPFDSPLEFQSKGRLCTAYGECPSCPMAIVKPNDSISVAYWDALLRAIYRSVNSITSGVWSERWSPVASDLKALISLVPENVLMQSRKIHLELPNVG